MMLATPLSVSCDVAIRFPEPSRLILKAHLLAERHELPIALYRVESYTELELPEVHRTKVERSGVGFLQVVRSVHYAVKGSAVVEPEYVAGLVRQDLAAPPQDQTAPLAGVFSRSGMLAPERSEGAKLQVSG